MQLQYFGEQFDPTNCQRTCDNCSAGRGYIDKDITEECQLLVTLLLGSRTGLNTLNQISNLLKGGGSR